MEPRKRFRVTYKQLNLFVKFMSDNPDLARGVNYRTAFGKHYHDAKWSELAKLLNAQENGMNKSPREWNRYWVDLKSGIKKKVQAMKTLPERTKTLSSIEQVIYKNLCNNRNRKKAVIEEKDFGVPVVGRHGQFAGAVNGNFSCRHGRPAPARLRPRAPRAPTGSDARSVIVTTLNLMNDSNCSPKHVANSDYFQCSYLQIPTESDHEPEQYEVEYLEETSCDETQMTNISDIEPVDSSDNGLEDSTHIGVKSTELGDRNDQALDRLGHDKFLVDAILNESSSTAESKTDMAEEATVMNDLKIKNCDKNKGMNTNTNNYNTTDVLTDIRNHLKELVAVQKERARSQLRLASAHERRAILEEKRVRIEERRLRMEERRVALEERKMEALEKRCFAQERLASAAERKNEITEHRMANSDFVTT